MAATKEPERPTQCRWRRRDMPRYFSFPRAAHWPTLPAPKSLGFQSSASWTSQVTPEAKQSGSDATPSATTGTVSCSCRVEVRPHEPGSSQSDAFLEIWWSSRQTNHARLFPRSFMNGGVCSMLPSSTEAVELLPGPMTRIDQVGGTRNHALRLQRGGKRWPRPRGAGSTLGCSMRSDARPDQRG